MIRKATAADIDAVFKIYSDTHTFEEEGKLQIGWIRELYPTRETAENALFRNDLFVLEQGGEILGAAIINQLQVEEYYDAKWHYPAVDNEVMVLHTLVISPFHSGKGLGRAFVDFYENYALDKGCKYLRMDTNERNLAARVLYKKLGFSECDIIPCSFNGINGVRLVLLEKKL